MNLCQTLWASYDALKQAHSDAEMFLEEGKDLSLADYKNALEKLLNAKEDYKKSLYTTLPDEREIYTLDYLSIMRLCDANEVDLNEILAMQYDCNLKDRRVLYLNLSYTNVSDLSPLAVLTNLQKLDLSNTQVSDLAPLASLTNLKVLWCSTTQVSNLTPLAGLTNLERLECDNTKVSDLTPLKVLTNLQVLWCFDTQVSDLTPLADLTNLTAVCAENNKLNTNSVNLAQQKGWKIWI